MKLFRPARPLQSYGMVGRGGTLVWLAPPEGGWAPPEEVAQEAPMPTMDFRPRETLFFCDNFLTLELIGFNFRHEPFQLKRQFLSIWFINEKSKFRVLVADP